MCDSNTHFPQASILPELFVKSRIFYKNEKKIREGKNTKKKNRRRKARKENLQQGKKK